jgi:hypothetical protein
LLGTLDERDLDGLSRLFFRGNEGRQTEPHAPQHGGVQAEGDGEIACA